MKQGVQVKSIDAVPVAEVIVRSRLREVSEAGVASLVTSIRRLGVMKDPIQVRRTRDAEFVLMAGGHRLEAAKALGWETIPAVVWDCNDAWASFMEIDDNLAGAELNTLDTALFLAARKRLYEKEFPQAAHGGDRGNQHTGGRQNDIVSFCQTTALKFGKSRRQVERLVSAGERLDPRDIQLLRQAPNAVTLKDLQDISKIGETVERYNVVEALSEGRAKTVAEARRQLAGKPPPKSPVDVAMMTLLKAWDRAPAAARRRFLEERTAQVLALKDSLGE